MNDRIKSPALWATMVVCSMAVLVVCGCPWYPFPPDTLPDTTEEVIAEAAERARQLDPDAIIFQVSGINVATLDGTGSHTLEWELVAVNPDAAEVTWRLSYDRVEWTTEQIDSMLVGVAYFDLLEVEMTEAQARDRLVAEGLGDDFFGWNLSQPLHPDFPNPLYAFNYGDESATVDTVTGTVSTLIVETGEPPLGATPGDDSVSTQYILAASEEIKQTDPDAIIIWAGGRDGAGAPLEAAGDTNTWDFDAIAIHDSEVRAWTLHYDGTWVVTEMPFPPFGIVFMDLTTVGMDVVEAWTIAVDTGFAPPFAWWSLLKELHPNAENPVYVFPIEGGYVLVDTVTGQVIR